MLFILLPASSCPVYIINRSLAVAAQKGTGVNYAHYAIMSAEADVQLSPHVSFEERIASSVTLLGQKQISVCWLRVRQNDFLFYFF